MGNILSIFKRPAISKKPFVILITGASAGIGKSMALTMVQRGHVVYGAARRVENMQDIVEAGGHALKLDVTNKDEVDEAVQQILKQQGRIDVLVNNAGVSIVGAAEDVTMDQLRRLFEVNFFGLVNLTQKVLPSMRQARSGLIVNVSSVAGKIYKPFMSSYSASKHALEGWSDCLRTELAAFNVNVSIIEPGFVATEIFEKRQNITPEGSPYQQEVDISEEEYRKFWPKAAPPSVCADALVHACEMGYPKRRYIMGFMSTTVLFIRNWLGDGFMDFISRRVLERGLKKSNEGQLS